MQLVFTRMGERLYVSRITRGDGVRFLVNGVGHMSPIPHDLAHFAVESALNLTDGLWGSVAAGAVLPSMTYLEGRRRPRAQERSAAVLKTNDARLNEAEVLVRIFNTAFEKKQSDAELRAWLAERRMVPEHALQKIGAKQIDNVRASWHAMEGLWSRLPVGGDLPLEWPERRQRDGKAAMVTTRSNLGTCF